MLGSGITLIDGLGTVQKLVYNRHLAQTISHARDKIIQGSTFADALDENATFSPMLKKMIAVGQQSGDLKGVLHEVADYQDDQFAALIRRLNAIMTPALTVGVGGIVGYVYIAFFVALLAAGS
jgi:type IV pilus assembly protein PilC